MNLLRLAWRSLLNRRFAVILTVLTIALSIGLLVLVEQLRAEVRQGFYRSVSGTDLIVGAARRRSSCCSTRFSAG
jgi:putative ABC transport system permease protein